MKREVVLSVAALCVSLLLVLTHTGCEGQGAALSTAPHEIVEFKVLSIHGGYGPEFATVVSARPVFTVESGTTWEQFVENRGVHYVQICFTVLQGKKEVKFAAQSYDAERGIFIFSFNAGDYYMQGDQSYPCRFLILYRENSETWKNGTRVQFVPSTKEYLYIPRYPQHIDYD